LDIYDAIMHEVEKSSGRQEIISLLDISYPLIINKTASLLSILMMVCVLYNYSKGPLKNKVIKNYITLKVANAKKLSPQEESYFILYKKNIEEYAD
jgi:hypothetical protein